MKYRRITVTNLGYVSPSVDSPTLNPVEIWGLDNQGDERFEHLGYGYPDLSGVTVHAQIEQGSPTEDKDVLLAYEGDTLTIGADVPDPLAVLKADFGWPDDAYLDGDGVPTMPEPE